MVKKVEQQRVDSVQPELVLCQTVPAVRLATIDFRQVQPVQDTIDLKGPVEVHNFGVGLARDIVSTVVVGGQTSPAVALPPLAPEFWTNAELSPHWRWLEAKRLKEVEQESIPAESRGRIPDAVGVELRYRDTLGQCHATVVRLKHDDSRGDYFYKVKSIEYRHLDKSSRK